MPFVLDSSAALAWVLPDERSAAIDPIADRLQNDTAVVPAVWPFEILNALLMATRRARISSEDLQGLLANLAVLPIEIEQIEMATMLDAVSRIAALHGITSYDAAYVELAQRRNVAIATLDNKLRGVCAAEGVSVIP